MPSVREALEAQLNDFSPRVRHGALLGLLGLVERGETELPSPTRSVNLHCHSFYSFNGYGLSPTAIAWKARSLGLGAVGLVDFDVLDGVFEMLDVCGKLDLRAGAGIETRVFVPEFASDEINSPGEPGIAYFMGCGFTDSHVEPAGILPELKETARNRNLKVIERINPHLLPVELDYETDVLPITPNGNATERHLCIAYDTKARTFMPDDAKRAAWWGRMLNTDAQLIQKMFEEPPVFHGFIRAKLIKSGGVGYVKAEGPDFPQLKTVAEFIRGAAAIPTYAWLDGTTSAEQKIDDLLDLMIASGVEAINVIPDRNWNIKDAEVKKRKVKELHRIVEIASDRSLPLIVGTEMNAYGQPYVDDFAAPEMAPLIEPAWEGALVMHGHTVLQRHVGMGYTSRWASTHFSSAGEKVEFYKRVGERAHPSIPEEINEIGPEMGAAQVLQTIKATGHLFSPRGD